jgi:hypothetical protein
MLSNLVDWKAFEIFVKKLYDAEGTLSVERDVTLIGRSGARRQVDVRLTLKTALHTYVTIVECKRWKEPVGRDRIDVLTATVEDLSASKGVMFTTTGYEEGAKQYAQHKAVDLFLVRDLTDEEWGVPGRYIRFYGHFITSRLDNIALPDAISFSAVPGWRASLDVKTGPGAVDSGHILHSIDTGKPGTDTLGKLLTAIKAGATKRIGDAAPILDGGRNDAVAIYRTDLSMSFDENGRHRDLVYPDGRLRLHTLTGTLFTMVRQSRIERDRADKVDLAVALEDHLGGTRKLVIQEVGSDSVTLGDLQQPSDTDREGALVNDSILKTYFIADLEPLSADEMALATPTKEQKILYG